MDVYRLWSGSDSTFPRSDFNWKSKCEKVNVEYYEKEFSIPSGGVQSQRRVQHFVYITAGLVLIFQGSPKRSKIVYEPFVESLVSFLGTLFLISFEFSVLNIILRNLP